MNKTKDFTPDPYYEEEYWNIIYYFNELNRKHQTEVLKQLELEKNKGE